jgi:ubiquinone/menaquinone biosynthesis C-methylase UbiE
MGLYSKYVFPRLMDRVLSTEEIDQIRRSLLSEVRGDIFEIGFGTGLNLPHYPDTVKRITTADPSIGGYRLAQRRIAQSRIEVLHRPLNGESLPFADNSFDSVVCTFTLCSIADVDKALLELRRILKPSGRIHFVEHGLADDPRLQWWQHKLTPLQRRIGDGCHLDRDIRALLLRSGFRIEHLDNLYLKGAPRLGGYLYRGIATKA